MCGSTFVAEGTFLYHLKDNFLAQYSLENGDILSHAKLSGRAVLCSGVLYIINDAVAEGRHLVGNREVRLANVPEDTEYIHMHGESAFFVSRAGNDISVHRDGSTIFSSKDVHAYQFEDNKLYFLTSAQLKKLDLATLIVSIVAEARKIMSFSVKNGSVALGLRSGKVYARDIHFHWHNTAVQALQLSATCNEVYSVSTKKVVHRYSLGTQRYRILFDFVGTFLSLRVFDGVLVLESKASLVAYSLKYDRVLQKIYLFTHVDKHIVLDQRSTSESFRAEALEAAEDLVKNDLSESTFVFANDGLVVYCDALNGRALKVLSLGVEIRSFFADRSLLYIATKTHFLIYHLGPREFCLVKRVELKAGAVGQIDAAVLRCNDALLLSSQCVYRVSEFTGFLKPLFRGVHDLFVFAGAVYRVDSEGIARDERHVHLETGIERVRVIENFVYLKTEKGITVLNSEWKVVHRVAVTGIVDFVVSEEKILVLRNTDTGRELVSIEKSCSEHMKEGSPLEVARNVSQLISRKYCFTSTGELVLIANSKY
eukprot:jgi/Antlo1/1800/1886